MTGKWYIYLELIGFITKIADDGTIYVVSGDNNLYAVNPDGTEKWSFETGDWVWSSPAIGEDGTIYFGYYDFYLYALNSDGTEKWRFKTGRAVGSSPAIGEDGTIYVSSYDNNLYAIHSEHTDGEAGTEKWRFKTGDFAFPSPAIGSDGTIYFGSNDNNLYAITGEPKLTINKPEGEGTVEINGEEVNEWPYKEDHEHGSEVELKAIPEEGWYFEEWTGDYTGTEEEITVTMDEDKVITANFEIYEYELEISIEGEGSVDLDLEQERYEHGTEVELTAVPEEGWYFEGWTGDHESEEKEITIIIDEDKSITAHFEVEEYTLTIDTVGEGEVGIEPEKEEYEHGEEVTLTAVPDEGWEFDGWTGDVPEDEEGEQITITMDEDKEITAVFEEEDEGVPGFTSTLLLLAAVIAVAIYHKKEQ